MVSKVLAFDNEVISQFDKNNPWVPDVIVVVVKSHSLPSLAPVLAPLASTDPHGELANAVPRARIIGAVVYPSCSSPEPGVARHDAGSRLVFGTSAAVQMHDAADVGRHDRSRRAGLQALQLSLPQARRKGRRHD